MYLMSQINSSKIIAHYLCISNSLQINCAPCSSDMLCDFPLWYVENHRILELKTNLEMIQFNPHYTEVEIEDHVIIRKKDFHSHLHLRLAGPLNVYYTKFTLLKTFLLALMLFLTILSSLIFLSKFCFFSEAIECYSPAKLSPNPLSQRDLFIL